MLNVNQITSQLAKMPDQALQQYAAMHKNDPYILALAISESNRRKEVRGAAQQAHGAQPKVVDQELAEMSQPMPEEVGIGALPAPNMQGMAGGGIVAFEEGGEVPRFQDQGFVKYPYGMAGTQTSDLISIPGLVTGQPFQTANNPDLAKRIAEIEAMPRASRATKDQLIAQAKQEAGLAATQSPLTSPTKLPPAGSPKLPDTTVVPAAKKDADAAGLAAAAAKTEADKAAADKAAADAAARQTTAPTAGLPSLAGYEKKFSDIAKANETRLKEAIDRNAQTKEQAMQEIADIDKPYMDAAKAAIDKETSRLKSDKEQDFYMALIQGGLAAAGESGPNALQNIAKGFATGAGSYKEALKDFRKATQENTKAEMALKQYEATGKKDALKSFNDHQARRDDRYATGLAQIMNQQTQTLGQLTAQEMQSRTQAAVASMPGAQERLFASLADPTSAAAKGFKNYAQLMGPEARGDSSIRTAAINKWSSEPMLRQEFNNDFDSYFRMMAGQQAAAGATPSQLAALKKYGVSVP